MPVFVSFVKLVVTVSIYYQVEFKIYGFNLDLSTSFNMVDCLVEEGLSHNGFSFEVLLQQFFFTSHHMMCYVLNYLLIFIWSILIRG